MEKFKIKKMTPIAAAALSILSVAVPVFAENSPSPEAAATTAAEKSPYSLSLEGVYGKALKKAERGGVDSAGLDFRLNYEIDATNQFSLGLLMFGGSENIGEDRDLDAGNFSLLAGYRAAFPLLDERVKLYLGARIGFSCVDYVIDAGRENGWDHYREDSDFCAAYAGEIGISYAFSPQWSVRGGYEFYGNTAKIGGGDAKFSEQQYHLFQIGAEYRF